MPMESIAAAFCFMRSLFHFVDACPQA